MDPLPYWRRNDAPDRQGITEIRHITGYFAYWDALLKEHPNMLIDSCASGGRRNDLETLRRAVPLLRSDYIIEPVGNQCHTYALSFWVPFYGTGTGAIDPYLFRSVMCPHFTACFDMRNKDANWDLARKLVGEWRKIAPCMLGDYYPLTPYSLANDAWIGWQFDRPEEGDGVIQVFRRGDSIYRQAELKLHGLDADKDYAITDLDTNKVTRMQGPRVDGAGAHYRDRPKARGGVAGVQSSRRRALTPRPGTRQGNGQDGFRIAKPALLRDIGVYDEAQSTRLALARQTVAASGALAWLAGLAELFMAARRDQPARRFGIDEFQHGQPAEGHGRGRLDHRRLLHQWRLAPIPPAFAGDQWLPFHFSWAVHFFPYRHFYQGQARGNLRRSHRCAGDDDQPGPQLPRAQHLSAKNVDGRPGHQQPRPPAGVYRG